MLKEAIGQSSAVTHDDWHWWRRWVAANALAEVMGLGTSASLWLLFFMGMEQRFGTLAAAIIVVMGSTLLEGSAVGIAQWRVLRHPLPALSLAAWWGATALGAFIAWTVGMVPSTLMALDTTAANSAGAAAPVAEMSDALTYGLAAAMGLVLGPVLALPQWWVLRRYVAAAWQWIPANAAAWVLGMPLIFAAIGLVPGPTNLSLSIGIVLVGLALAGATVGAVHGFVLMRLLGQSPARQLAPRI